jgi:DNA-binding IclR family transcriptional regulator
LDFDAYNFSKSVLLDLAMSTGDAAHLFVRTGYHAVCVASFLGDNRLQVEKKVGEHIPMNVAGAPMVILAHLPKREQENIIKNLRMVDYTPHTITDRGELRQHLKQVYAQGYSIDIEEFMIGGCAVSAPIFDQVGSVTGAISVETPSVRFNEERKDEIIKQVVKSAQQITDITAQLFLQISKVDR